MLINASVGIGVFLSSLVVLTCIVSFAMLYNDVNTLYNEIMADMTEIKVSIFGHEFYRLEPFSIIAR